MSTNCTPSLRLVQIPGHRISPAVPVFLPHDLNQLEFYSLVPMASFGPAYTFPALLNWLTRLVQNFKLQEDASHPYHNHPYKLRELDVQAVDWFWRNVPGKEDKLGFMKIQAKIETDPYVHEGEKEARADWLPGAVFLRGGSVAILVLPRVPKTCSANKPLTESDHTPTCRRIWR
jgi:ADP-sugar diphosphatase